ncbi:hypothetical protein AJ79_01882 [Helicocarpus griseus UAMH5409]|uniref:MARVEL domain-containing protein n=1 Tax=Helicocarpus griseus UAMH5409 TaxID=1447875 RepID=A0A2B7Y523_9EURO|nr:hypothetical protein AJ79_01882 [Helicocarpus griseus UAMH5409]
MSHNFCIALRAWVYDVISVVLSNVDSFCETNKISDGIDSSISIACWVVVFSPQIIENFRRGSADGLSLLFLVVWLAGDIFNILGAVLQGVLPTMIILAVYYTLADIVLLCQCFYYRGFTLSDTKPSKRNSISSIISAISQGERQQNGNRTEDTEPGQPSEHSPLLTANGNNHHPEPPEQQLAPERSHSPSQERERIFHRLHHYDTHHPRRPSLSSLRHQISMLDGTHLSPAMPLIDPAKAPRPPTPPTTTTATPQPRHKPTTTLQIFAFNTFSVALVCAAGVLGWYVSVGSSRSVRKHPHHRPTPPPSDDSQHDALTLDLWGQIFGYLCAALYLGSRIPQLLLNCRRKSTEGVSMLFFLFACVGNLTYVLSIFAFSPRCDGAAGDGVCEPGEQGRIYARYIMVNASWLLGSLGTLALDLGIFAQFIMYREKGVDEEGDEEEDVAEGPSGERVRGE